MSKNQTKLSHRRNKQICGVNKSTGKSIVRRGDKHRNPQGISSEVNGMEVNEKKEKGRNSATTSISEQQKA